MLGLFKYLKDALVFNGLCCSLLSNITRNQGRLGGGRGERGWGAPPWVERGLTFDTFPICLMGHLLSQLHQNTFIIVLTTITQLWLKTWTEGTDFGALAKGERLLSGSPGAALALLSAPSEPLPLR